MSMQGQGLILLLCVSNFMCLCLDALLVFMIAYSSLSTKVLTPPLTHVFQDPGPSQRR